jgi:hypothetical protein
LDYTVLSPQTSRPSVARTPISPRLTSLKGKVVYCIAQDKPVLTEELGKRLSKYIPGVKVVFKKRIGWITADNNDLKEAVIKKADAMIYGTAMGGGSGMSAVKWIKDVESRGIPSVYTVTEPYIKDIIGSADMVGMPALRTVVVPLIREDQVTVDITDKQYLTITKQIVDALTRPLSADDKKAGKIAEKKIPRIAMTGTLDEVQEYFLKHDWTDGLPIIPPTEAKVKEMLKGTSHSSDEVVTHSMFPEENTVTVEKAAIVGAMAGCKPEYMPVLLSIIHTWGNNFIFSQAARSDSSFSVMIIINGPIRNELKMNSDLNTMGPGNQANATIGRFLRLAIIALGGSQPGFNDLSTQGNPLKYTFCFAENEEKNPWQPLHVSAGLKEKESAVSMLAGGWCHWSFSGDLDHIARAVAGFYWHRQSIVILAPGAARVYAHKGMSKEDVEHYIWEHALPQLTDFIPKWFHFEIPTVEPTKGVKRDDTMKKDFPDGSVRVVVAGGETGQPIAQAWQYNPPVTTSIDAWR